MSKTVKKLMMDELSARLSGVDDAVLVNVVGMNANNSVVLRQKLREKNIQIMLVKNSLARKATEGTPLGAAFEGLEGAHAVVWGCEDFVSLCKEVATIDKSGEFEPFAPKGGVMDGEQLTPERVKEISKWPNREEQLSMLLGQILSPGANLSAALLGPGAALASQVKKISEGEGAAAE